MKVSNKINVCEVDGKEEFGEKYLTIDSHWNYSDRVILYFKDEKITVLASDLKKAIDNACNHKRY